MIASTSSGWPNQGKTGQQDEDRRTRAHAALAGLLETLLRRA
jgi:hypothetical protein